MQRFALVLGLLGAASVAMPANSVRAVEVSVRGEAQMTLDVAAAGTTVVMKGRLIDDLGDPLPAQPVRLAIEPRGGTTDAELADVELEVETDFFGAFEAHQEVAPGSYTVRAYYDGASHVSDVDLRRRLEVVAAPVVLAISAPSWVLGDQSAYPIDISATANGVVFPGTVSVAVDGLRLGSVELAADGTTQVDIGEQVAVGRSEVTVEMRESEHRRESSATHKVRRVADLSIDGTVDSVFRRFERGVEVAWTIEDQAGPVPEAQVTVILERIDDSEDEPAGPAELSQQAVTGAEGTASVVFPNDDLGTASWRARAIVSAPGGGSVTWEGGVVEAEPARATFIFRILGGLVLLLGSLWLARQVIALITARLRAWIRRRRARSETDNGDLVEDEVFAAEAAVELVAQPADEAGKKGGWEVQIWDEWDKAPVANARLRVIETDADAEEFEANDRGVVRFEKPRPMAVLVASAPGYVPARVTRGEAGAGRFRLPLTPVPLKIRRAYRKMVRTLKGADRWGTLTPRQIEAVLRRIDDDISDSRDRDESPRLASSREPTRRWRQILADWEQSSEDERGELLMEAITALVEETNYSGRQYDGAVWQVAREAMTGLIALYEQPPRAEDPEDDGANARESRP